MNQLEKLKKYTTIVADSGDFESIERFKPKEATTNPSLILAASNQEKYKYLLDEAISYARSKNLSEKDTLNLALDQIFVNFATKIANIVPGRVSVEVDASLSFDVNSSVTKAKELISMLEEKSVPREKILIKLATTWEGIETAKILKKENINCNMTLLFSLEQAIAVAQANIQLISPFVGRIYDWYVQNTEQKTFLPHLDPGVLSVKNIYNYYKKYGHNTQIMGASFRNTDQIKELAGCDLLTIAPKLLEKLENSFGDLSPTLSPEVAIASDIEKNEIDKKAFMTHLESNIMAKEKLLEGIKKFSDDMIILEKKTLSIL